MNYRNEIWNKECDVVPDDSRTAMASLPLLSAAINEAERNIQAPRGLLINAAFTAISIALQGLIDVNKPNTQRVPVSLMLLAIANSGERKSTAENVFLKSIRGFQSKHAIVFSEQLQDWSAEHDAWVVRRKAVLRNIEKQMSKGLPTKEAEAALVKLGREFP
jgi:hydroxyethylthiazole kinase-like sugar kinase family protein